MRYTLTHDIDCSPERFWELMVSTDFSRKLFAHIGVPDWDVEQKDEGDEIIRHVNARAKMNLPGPLRKLFGAAAEYTEVTHFDKKKKEIAFVITTPMFSDKVTSEGVIRAAPRGDKGCHRIGDMLHEAKIFGIGGLLERAMERQTRMSTNKAVDFINQWLKDHP